MPKGEDPVIRRCARGGLPGISRIHQCSILSNLMNNAMEAVEYLPESARWIRADIR